MKEEEAPEEALEVQFKFGHEEGKVHQTINNTFRKENFNFEANTNFLKRIEKTFLLIFFCA